MSLKRLSEQNVSPTKPPLSPTLSSPPSPLTFKDGWNFGLGFFTAAFIFSFVIIPTVSCMMFLALTIFGASLAGIGSGFGG